MDTAIIMPARNEGKTIAGVVAGALKYGTVIVVDDGSDDDTYRVAKASGAVVLRHAVNLGKGAALKTGCDYAVLKGFGRIVTIDADAQHEPKQIPDFLKLLSVLT